MGTRPTTWDTQGTGRVGRWPATWLATATLGIACLIATGVLVAIGHTDGKAVDGPISAAYGAAVAVLSLGYLASGRRHWAALVTLVILWLCLAWFGLYGSDAHASIAATTPREPPSAAPLLLSVIGVCGAAAVLLGGLTRKRSADQGS